MPVILALKTYPIMSKIHSFVYYGKLPSFNEFIEKAKGDRFGAVYRQWKKEKDEAIAWRIKDQLRGVKITCNCAMVIRWYSQTRGTDPDNIEAAKKYICDALQWAGTIKNDGWKELGGNTLHEHYVDPINPRIEVYLLENIKITYPGLPPVNSK